LPDNGEPVRAILNRLADGLKNYRVPAHKQALPATESEHDSISFIDLQRRLRIYLRALWDCDFIIKQANIDALGDEICRPFIEYSIINLPDAFFDGKFAHITEVEAYRAAATHAAAHIFYRKQHLSPRSLDKLQIALISLIEDARVEMLAICQFPGLKHRWAMQHSATPADNTSTGDYLNRLARALLDDSYQDDDPWVVQGRGLFNAIEDLQDERVCRDLGIRLADLFRHKKIKFNNKTDTQTAPYRDDNRYLWRRQSVPLELFSPFFRSKSAVGIEDGDQHAKKRAAPAPEESPCAKYASATYLYPEWNYRSRSEDQSWVTLRERTPATGNLKIIEKIITENQHLISRMKALLCAIRDGATHRIRKLEEGDEIDINAAIRTQIDIRQGIPPDPRIMMRSVRKSRDISVLLLVDLSRSMNSMIKDQQHTALELTKQASVLFAEALESVGDPFAIHGFYSDSRHYVEYFRVKDFEQPYDELPKARIAGMIGQRGTRMGAAIRHASYHLNNRKSSKKLLLILTDGEPSDVDAPDRKYLHDDTKKAVETAKRSGIHTYCISLDPSADQYVSRIFGAMNYMVVDHVKCLPKKVLLVYAGLSH